MSIRLGNKIIAGSNTAEVEVRLYDTTGDNTDGAMTQAAVTDALNATANLYAPKSIEETIEEKADKATTLAGYNITDAYTIDQVNSALGEKANVMDLGTMANKNADDYLTAEETEGKFAEIIIRQW